MDDEVQSSAAPRLDASALDSVEVTGDGRLRLRLRDASGHAASLTLPLECLGAVLAAVPAVGDTVRPLAAWSLGAGGGDLVLTLRTPDGASVAFAVKPWQIAAIASLAGPAAPPPAARLN